MLDDLKFIHEKDAQDALGIAEKQWQQLEYKFELPELNFDVQNVVFAGMGGSALAALISQSWPSYKIPFEITRGYDLPAHVGDKTLCVICSYSGNTEETLACLEQAKQKTSHIAVIASGGKAVDQAKAANLAVAVIPQVQQPRFAVFYMLKALVTILEKASLVAANGAEADLHAAAEYLQRSTSAWRPDVPTAQNQAKQIAQELMGKSVVIYSGPKLFPAAYKWKISINENAKHIAWYNQLPEMNHNEILGWTEQPVQKPYAVIDLRSSLEHPRVQKRFEITEKLLSGRRPSPIVVEPKGETLLEQLVYSIALGDFVSIYLALLNGLNPTPVELIEKLKKELAQ